MLCPARCNRPPKRQPIAPAPMTAIRKSSDLPLRIELCSFVLVHSKNVPFFGEGAVSNLNRITLERLLDQSCNIHVAFGKLRREAWIQSNDIMKHEHLPIAKAPRSNPDRRNGHHLGYVLSNFLGYHFQYDSRCSGLLKRLRVLNKFVTGIDGSTLDSVSTV